MSIQILPEEGSVFGRLGRGLGEGLSAQLPKEIERLRLSSGLSKLSESRETDPLKRLAQLHAIPGMTPQLAEQAQKYLQSSQLRQAYAAEQPGQAGISQEPRRQQGVPSDQKELPPKFGQNLANYLVPSTQEELGKQAADIETRSGIPFQEALQLAEQSDVKRLQSQTDFEQRATLGANALKSYVEGVIQKSGAGVYGDTPGELLADYEVRTKNDIANGMSPDQAARKSGDELLNFAKARNKLKVSGPSRWDALVSGETSLKELKAAQKVYDKAGHPEMFMNDLITYQKLSLPYASELAYPPDPNASSFFKALPSSGLKGKGATEVYQETLRKLKPQDSLQTFALELNRKGYDGKRFLSYAAENASGLNGRQTRELQEIGNFQPSFSDILYFTLLGKGSNFEGLRK